MVTYFRNELFSNKHSTKSWIIFDNLIKQQKIFTYLIKRRLFTYYCKYGIYMSLLLGYCCHLNNKSCFGNLVTNTGCLFRTLLNLFNGALGQK